MDTCVIFCAGGLAAPIRPFGPGDYLLAADGGVKHLQTLGLQPHGIIGDFDSLGYIPENAQVFPVEKDDTDSMLAVKKGLELGYRRFELYGALDGKRLDHTIANLQLLQYLEDRGAEGWLVGEHYLVTAVKDATLHLPKDATGILSVFCLGKDATGVTLRGLQYPLEKGTLQSSFPLGVSNHFIGEAASVTVESGTLIVLYDTVNGFGRKETHADL